MPAMQLEKLPDGVNADHFGEIELRGFPGSISVVALQGVPASVDSDTGELWTRTPFI